MRKDTANAMPIVIASSLLIINLGPELVLVSSDSSAKDSSGQTPLALMKCLCCHHGCLVLVQVTQVSLRFVKASKICSTAEAAMNDALCTCK